MTVALDWREEVAPADRLVTMPPFPWDGTVRTLGPQVVDWAHERLIQPNGPRAGRPFRFTGPQIEFLCWAYALDERARWLFNLLVRRLAKGSGKSPFAAANALAEFLGPVRLDRFDDRAIGGALGKPVDMPLVQIVAAAESQTKNTMRFVRAFCPKGGRLESEYQLDIGKTQIFKQPEGTLEVITSSFTAAEGAQATFAVGDEPEHWTPSNNGHDLASTVIDNLTKTGGRMLQTCNAWKPGAQSVAESVFDDWVMQEEGSSSAPQRILYDARVAPAGVHDADRETLQAALEHVYDGCPWVDVENIQARFYRRSADPSDNIRKYLNRPTVDNRSWVKPEWWADMLAADTALAADDDVALFFDGSKSRDATALVGCRIEDGHVFTVGVWEPDLTKPDETVDAGAVDAAVAAAFEAWNVVAFFADVREWESFALTSWPQLYGDRLIVWSQPAGRPPQPVAWDMRGHSYEFAKAAEACHAEIEGGEFTHGPASGSDAHRTAHAVTARHVANCRTREYRDAVTVRKETASKRIDAAVCVIGARMVRRLVLADPKYKKHAKRKRRTSSGYSLVLS